MKYICEAPEGSCPKGKDICCYTCDEEKCVDRCIIPTGSDFENCQDIDIKLSDD